jgi:hypothetical protein
MRFFLCCLFLIHLSGCARYKVCTQTFQTEPSCENPIRDENKRKALCHPLYRVIPRHRCQIKWYDLFHWTTWSLFGNDNSGVFGEEAGYRLQDPVSVKKALLWNLRNPLHNFTFYVIGTAGQQNSEFTLLKISGSEFEAFKYKPKGKTNFGGEGTSFYLGFHGWKPFISLRVAWCSTKTLDFYLGWRHRGNFGIKLASKKRKRAVKGPPQS